MNKFFTIFFGVIDGIVNAFVTEHSSNVSYSNTADNYIPHNYIETSIQAVANQAVHSDFDTTKKEFANQIMEIITTNWHNISSTTKSYAIAQLNRISSKMDYDCNKRYVSSLITRIATKSAT